MQCNFVLLCKWRRRDCNPLSRKAPTCAQRSVSNDQLERRCRWSRQFLHPDGHCRLSVTRMPCGLLAQWLSGAVVKSAQLKRFPIGGGWRIDISGRGMADIAHINSQNEQLSSQYRNLLLSDRFWGMCSWQYCRARYYYTQIHSNKFQEDEVSCHIACAKLNLERTPFCLPLFSKPCLNMWWVCEENWPGK